MLKMTFQRHDGAEKEYREIASVNNPGIAQQALQEWSRAVRYAKAAGQELITLTFNGEADPVVIDTHEAYTVEWEYIP